MASLHYVRCAASPTIISATKKITEMSSAIFLQIFQFSQRCQAMHQWKKDTLLLLRAVLKDQTPLKSLG